MPTDRCKKAQARAQSELDWRCYSVAIPLFGQEVAPRFCFAPEVLIIAFEEGNEVHRQRISMFEMRWPERMHMLARHSVGVLLCGGFNRRLLPTARGLGIEVKWGLTGDAEEALEKFVARSKEH